MGLSSDTGERLVVGAALIMVSELMGYLFFDTFFGFAFAPLLYVIIRKELKEWFQAGKMKKVRNQFRDFLYSISGSFTAGRHMSEAIEEAIPYLESMYGDKAWLIVKLKDINVRSKTGMTSDVGLWQEMAEESGVEDIIDFVQVYAACRKSGGDMVRAIDNAASVISQKMNAEREIRTLAAQKVTEGRMIGVMPPLMILFLRLTSPGYIACLYETPKGRLVMVLALVGMGVSLALTEKITRIEV